MMKQWIPGMVIVGLLAAGVQHAAAQEPLSKPIAAPTAAKPRPAADQKKPELKGQRVTFLGTVTSTAPAALREQLKLPRDTGLVVDSVEAASPAEAAGLKQHDVLEKLNNQQLINVEQFNALVQSMKTGEEVTLEIIRQGARQTIKAKLGEKEAAHDQGMASLMLGAAPADQFAWANAGGDAPRLLKWNGPPPAMAGGMPLMLNGNVIVRNLDGRQSTEWSDDAVHISINKEGDQVVNVSITDAKTGTTIYKGPPPKEDDALFKVHDGLADKLKKAEAAAEMPPLRLLVGNGGGGAGGVGFFANGTGQGRGKVMRWQDDDHILMLRSAGTKPLYLLALSRKDGRTLYDGPVMTDEQRKAVPNEVSEKFEMLLAKPELATEFGAADKK
jgi:hypothetical protein